MWTYPCYLAFSRAQKAFSYPKPACVNACLCVAQERADTSSSQPADRADDLAQPPAAEVAQAAQSSPDYLSDTASSSAGRQPLPLPFTANDDNADEDDPFAVTSQPADADISKTSAVHDASRVDDTNQTCTDLTEEGLASSTGQGSSMTELAHQLPLLHQQLRESQQRSHELESKLKSFESTRVSEHHQHQQQLKLATEQHRHQIQLLQQQALQCQTEASSQKQRGDRLQQRLDSSEQQAQKLQLQLAQQLNDMKQADAVTAGLKSDLQESQHQLRSAQAELAAYQQEADSQLSHQLHEQQQALHETQQSLHSAQAQLQNASAELESSQTELERVQAELQASEQNLLRAQEQAHSYQQSLADRDAVWQEELQQQQAQTSKLQMVWHTSWLTI